MTSPFKVALVLFLLVLAIGIAFGVAHDLYSTEQGVVTATVVEARGLINRNKPSETIPPKLTVRLADGSVVSVATTGVEGLKEGAQVEVTEMVMPWGQVWYKRR
jgi:hypothetical protein